MEEPHPEDCICMGTMIYSRETVILYSGDQAVLSDAEGQLLSVLMTCVEFPRMPVKLYFTIPCRYYQPVQEEIHA